LELVNEKPCFNLESLSHSNLICVLPCAELPIMITLLTQLLVLVVDHLITH